jgi:hypothetical protein
LGVSKTSTKRIGTNSQRLRRGGAEAKHLHQLLQQLTLGWRRLILPLCKDQLTLFDYFPNYVLDKEKLK